MRAVIIGYYGGRNFGDECILEGILHSLKTMNPSFTPIVSTLDENHTARIHNVLTLPTFARNPVKFIRGLLMADCVIVGGGGHAWQESISLLSITVPALLGVVLGRPAFFLSIGVDPPINQTNRAILMATLRLASLLSVRDNLSANYLSQMGLKPLITPDPAFLYLAIR